MLGLFAKFVGRRVVKSGDGLEEQKIKGTTWEGLWWSELQRQTAHAQLALKLFAKWVPIRLSHPHGLPTYVLLPHNLPNSGTAAAHRRPHFSPDQVVQPHNPKRWVTQQVSVPVRDMPSRGISARRV